MVERETGKPPFRIVVTRKNGTKYVYGDQEFGSEDDLLEPLLKLEAQGLQVQIIDETGSPQLSPVPSTSWQRDPDDVAVAELVRIRAAVETMKTIMVFFTVLWVLGCPRCRCIVDGRGVTVGQVVLAGY